MNIQVNDKSYFFRESLTVKSFLEFQQVTKVAVEINGELIKEHKYESTVLQDGDVMEYMSYMAGGINGVYVKHGARRRRDKSDFQRRRKR